MAQPSLIYFAADAERNLLIQITKDLEFSLMQEQESHQWPLQIVRVEQLDTMREAVARLRKIKRMSIARRRKLVERLNPTWTAVAVDQRVPFGLAKRPGGPDADASGGVAVPV